MIRLGMNIFELLAAMVILGLLYVVTHFVAGYFHIYGGYKVLFFFLLVGVVYCGIGFFEKYQDKRHQEKWFREISDNRLIEIYKNNSNEEYKKRIQRELIRRKIPFK